MIREGVYVPRRDSNSWLNAPAGGRIFPAIHHHARFTIRVIPHRARASLETGAMESNGLTYAFRTPDGRSFRLPPGSSVMVGRQGGGADILFSHRALSRR